MNLRDIPARHVITFLLFFGMFSMNALRVNMSVAIVAMVREPHVAQDVLGVKDGETCKELAVTSSLNSTDSKNGTFLMRGEFEWNTHLRGQVLASFFYGFILTQIPGGILSDKFGGKWLFGIGMLTASVCTLLTPLAARWSVWALITARAIVGLGEGVIFPASQALIGCWAPKMERSRMATYCALGITLGNAAALGISGALCDSDFMGGWPSAFYVFGIVGCVWFVLWTWLAYDSPETHPGISEKELAFIRKGQDRGQTDKPQIPWRSILTSIPVWALSFTHMCNIFGYLILLIELPSYLSTTLHFNLKDNGVLSALPQVMYCLSSILAGVAADKARKSGRLQITTIRKIFNSIGFFGCAICLLIVSYAGCRPVLIVALLASSMGLLGMSISGFYATHVDMSPDFAGVLYGITNTCANIFGFFVPIYAGWVMEHGQTLHRWGVVFTTASALYIVSGVVYVVFCTAELQSWAKLPHLPPEDDAVEVTEMSVAKESERK